MVLAVSSLHVRFHACRKWTSPWHRLVRCALQDTKQSSRRCLLHCVSLHAKAHTSRPDRDASLLQPGQPVIPAVTRVSSAASIKRMSSMQPHVSHAWQADSHYLCDVVLQLTTEVDDLKRQVETLQAANTALTTTAEQEKQLAVSGAVTAASAKAEQARLALQAAQEERSKLQVLLSEAVAGLEQERKSKGKDQAQLER